MLQQELLAVAEGFEGGLVLLHLGPLRPAEWTEQPEDVETVKLALIVARCLPLANERIVRVEVLASPHYFRVHWGQLLEPEQVVEVAAGFDVEISRLVVQASLLDVVLQLADELSS